SSAAISTLFANAGIPNLHHRWTQPATSSAKTTTPLQPPTNFTDEPLVSDGEAQLGGAYLHVVVFPPKQGAACPTFTQGQTFTFLSASGPLSGSFSDAPEGGPELQIEAGEGCPKTSQTMRISYHRSGSTETVTGTVEAAAIEAREHQEAQEKKELKELKERLEAREKQEKEANDAKGGVLGAKESAPDATIAGKSATVSAAGMLELKITCPAGEISCAGTVTLRTLHAIKAANAGQHKPKVLTLASTSFDIAGGATKTVVLHLTATGRALLAHLHTLSVRATIVAHNPTGGTHSGQAILALHSKRAGRHKD
ncbi:MAG TPA: hypothetical protein VMD79_09820, partial [Solirubrobacteraceae bacterium]|nr:hypothetical protein [Solirubrobacteraceae bacterium]